MCKFSRTIYNRQLIQFARIPVEFVVRFIMYQNCVKVITFSMDASYLLLISSYSWCLSDLTVQCLELYTAYISQYHWDKQWNKTFHFPRKFHFLVKTITDSVRLQTSVQREGLCFVKFIYSLRLTSSRSTIYLFLLFSSFFNRSSIPDSRFSILTPDFPVNLEVLLIKIVLFFDHWRSQLLQSNQRFQAIEFVNRPVSEKLDMRFLFYGHEVLQIECVIVKYKATRINT